MKLKDIVNYKLKFNRWEYFKYSYIYLTLLTLITVFLIVISITGFENLVRILNDLPELISNYGQLSEEEFKKFFKEKNYILSNFDSMIHLIVIGLFTTVFSISVTVFGIIAWLKRLRSIFGELKWYYVLGSFIIGFIPFIQYLNTLGLLFLPEDVFKSSKEN